MSYISLYNRMGMVLPEIMSEHALVAGNTNSAGWWIC
jgi:hypothetical protein